MRMNRIWGTLAAIACVLWCGARAEAQLAKQGTYAGNFGWYAVGKTVELEPGHEFFLGEYSGTFLNDAGQGFLHGTSWVCPGVNDRTPGGAQAHGYCTVTDEDGDKAFVIWQCKGQPRCDGDFQWTGGTGKYMGLKGQTNFAGMPIGSTASGYSRFQGNWQLP
jgi:hypothetical protein